MADSAHIDDKDLKPCFKLLHYHLIIVAVILIINEESHLGFSKSLLYYKDGSLGLL